jgi:hypothetical protein
VQVRRHDGGEREELLDEDADGVVLEQLRARGGDHDGVDHERGLVLAQEVGDRLDDARAEEHPGLGGVGADVVEHRVELGAGEGRRRLVDGRDRGRALRGERHDRAHAVAAERGERLQVRLDPRAPARVRGRDGEAPGYHETES